MTPKDRFKGHFDFLAQLDEAIEAALKQYHQAEESDLEELRHLQREVGMARGTLEELCEKFAGTSGEAPVQSQAQVAAEAQDQASSEKSAVV